MAAHATFSTFGPDTLLELRNSWATVDDTVHVHTSLDMHDVGDHLVRAQFSDPVLDVEYFTLTYPDVYRLMQELKAIGAHNLAEGRRLQLTGKHRLQKFISAYETYRTKDNVLPATYEVIFGHAWAPALSENKKGEAHIPISAIAHRKAIKKA